MKGKKANKIFVKPTQLFNKDGLEKCRSAYLEGNSIGKAALMQSIVFRAAFK